ncbi:MerR family transcriptional regulator [Dongia deserti]|uniref:MerR family transcriptional regulator n=1 Tax=Dongia deserti TaxID=2268030 RepID=UPI000E646342|nr:helix-turn-helix domain-containing protein [Dongia deserti]
MVQTNTKLRAGAIGIGALSESSGVNIETIRYYERIGLLPAPPRSAGRHRLYGDAHRQRLVFIRRARELGFSLEEVRTLLGLGGGHVLTCGEVEALAQRHIAAIREKVRDLKRLERILSDLAARCTGQTVPECPILDGLNAESSTAQR